MAKKTLTMKFAGTMIKHLGLKMYGGAVPALVELISNSWDGDARKVRIKIPLNRALTKGDTIVVRDDGIGMSYVECENKYMILGRDRVKEEGEASEGSRRVMARKGIGKLAGFGIARKITIDTIRNSMRTKFTLNLDDIERLQPGHNYTIHDVQAEPTSDDDGTTVTLTDLSIRRTINEESFHNSLGRRFAVLSKHFKVYINTKVLKRKKQDFEFRFPPKGRRFNTETIETTKGNVDFKWWIGFQEETISAPELQGVSVVVNGKMAQKPWFFDLAGGQWGQHGKAYMCGEVVADYLDSKNFVDLIASHRSLVLWEHPDAQPLLKAMQKNVRKCLSDWAEMRAEKRVQQILSKSKLSKRIARYPARDQGAIKGAIKSLSRITTLKTENMDNLIKEILLAYDDTSFRQVLLELKEEDPPTLKKLLEILSEFRVLEALKLARIVWGRLEVIERLQLLVDEKASERYDLHPHVKDHPWLFGPEYDSHRHEQTLGRIVKEHFKLDITDDPDKLKRVDVTVMRGASDLVLFELKNPEVKIGWKELEQIERYVLFLREYAGSQISKEITRVIGFLVVSSYETRETGVIEKVKTLEENGIHVLTWSGLLAKTRRAHTLFLENVKTRAPEDPRLEDIPEYQDVGEVGAVSE